MSLVRTPGYFPEQLVKINELLIVSFLCIFLAKYFEIVAIIVIIL